MTDLFFGRYLGLLKAKLAFCNIARKNNTPWGKKINLKNQ